MARPALSKGEMEVARVLWEIGPATVREIHEKLTVDRDMNFVTVQTYLRRIEIKGYASSTIKGRVRTYAASAKPRTVIREAVGELVDRLFGGESLPLVRHLIEHKGIDKDGLAEIRRLIEQMEEKGGK
jgi:BlaI family transcriptional regulator, penicillinase repressor